MNRLPPRLGRWFWTGLLLVLLTVVVLTLFAALRGVQREAGEQLAHTRTLPLELKAVIAVTLSGGESFYVDAAALPALAIDLDAWLAARRSAARATLDAALAQGFDGLCAALDARVPDYADWYYSLGGSYGRLLHAAAGDLGDYLQDRLREKVFEPAGSAAAMDRLADDLDRKLAAQLQQSATDLQARLRQLLRQRRIDAAARLRLTGHWQPEQALSEGLAPFLVISGADVTREGAAGGAAALAGAAVFKKLGASAVAKSSAAVAAKQAAGALAALAAKFGLSSAAKGTGAVASGAGTAAGLCAFTGVAAPLAPVCALLGGAATGIGVWVLADKAVIEADEWINREAFERDMRGAFGVQCSEWRKLVSDRYAAGLEQGFVQMRGALRVPK